MKSSAQRKYYDWMEKQGKLPKEDMPEHAMAYGGMVQNDSEEDEIMHEHEHDSSGEPHTNDLYEDEQDMEFMSDGGVVGDEDSDYAEPMKPKKKSPTQLYSNMDTSMNSMNMGMADGGVVEDDQRPIGQRINYPGFPQPKKMSMGGKVAFARAIGKKRSL